MLRAMRLVVDTGLHAQGLDARAGDQVHARQLDAGAETDVVSEVERYIAMARARRSATRSASCASSELRHKARARARRTLRRARIPPRGAAATARCRMDVLEAQDRRAGSTRIVDAARRMLIRLASSAQRRSRSSRAAAVVPHQARPVPPAVDNPDALELARIADGYYERWLELNPLAATAQGDHRHDAKFGDYASPDVDGRFAGSGAGRAGRTARGRSLAARRRRSRHVRQLQVRARDGGRRLSLSERAAADQPALRTSRHSSRSSVRGPARNRLRRWPTTTIFSRA